MNKYAALGLLFAAAEGKDIAVISHTRRAAREAMSEFELPLGEGWTARRLLDGCIESPAGGHIRFLSMRQSLRGTAHDVIFLDVDVDREMTMDNYDDLRHALRGEDGEIIRA